MFSPEELERRIHHSALKLRTWTGIAASVERPEIVIGIVRDEAKHLAEIARYHPERATCCAVLASRYRHLIRRVKDMERSKVAITPCDLQQQV